MSNNLLQENNTINFTIASNNLAGEFVEYRPMKLRDLNLCNRISSSKHLDRIKFAVNHQENCIINLKSLVNLKENMKFSSIFLDYFENNVNFIQTVPILIRNAFGENRVNSVRYQTNEKILTFYINF